MKKTAICLMAALGLTAVSLTSCDNIKPVSELTNASDSLVYAVGVLTGNDVNNGIKNLGQPVDIDQFMKGAKKALYSDSTAFSYEVGFSFASGIKQQLKQMSEQLGITVDKDVYLAAFCAALNNDSTILMTPMNAQVAYRTIAMAAETKKIASSPEAIQNKADGEAFLAQKAKEEGVVATESGLLYKVVKAGKGDTPKQGSRVKVNYKGTLVDGTQFDASDNVRMVVGQMVPGFNEALMLMSPGAKYTIYIPAELGYGVRGRGSVPSNAVMIFDVELLSIEK